MLSMIVQPRISLHLHQTWMSSLEYINAKVQKTCGVRLKLLMREQMM